MAWRTLKQDDLASRLSLMEIEAYSSAFMAGDPVAELLVQTADEVRGYIAANRSAVLSDEPHSIPEMLVGPALDIAAFNVLKRVDIVPNEARAKACESAKELLSKIAEGKITPEPGKPVEPGSPSVAAPSIAVKPPIL